MRRGETQEPAHHPPHRTDCPAEEPSANRRARRAGEMRRGKLQEPSPRSLPILRIVPGGRAKRGPPPRREECWTLSDLLASLSARGRAPVLLALASGGTLPANHLLCTC